jgi:hypothetical protein
VSDRRTDIHDNRFLIVGGGWVTGLLVTVLFLWMLAIVVFYIYRLFFLFLVWLIKEIVATCRLFWRLIT